MIPSSSSYRFSFVERTTRFVSSSSSLNYSTKLSYYILIIKLNINLLNMVYGPIKSEQMDKVLRSWIILKYFDIKYYFH